jgi:hypothetical protein
MSAAVDHSVHTFTDEALAFTDRHRDLNPGQAGIGGMVWGFMRAIAECPDCPGTFRIPLDEEWHELACPKCHGVWTFQAEPPPPVKRPRRKKVPA